MVKMRPKGEEKQGGRLSTEEIGAIEKAGVNQSITPLEIPKASTKLSEKFAVLQINHIKNPR
jgi:hypothetical protein